MLALEQYKSSPAMPHWTLLGEGPYYRGPRALENAKVGLEREINSLRRDAVDSGFGFDVTITDDGLRALVLWTHEGKLQEGYKLVLVPHA